MPRCKSGIPIFFSPTLLEGEDPNELARISAELHTDLRPAPGVETMWTEALITQVWSYRRHLAMEARLDARLTGCGADKKTDAEFGILLNMKAHIAALIEADEERFRASLRAIEYHREFFLRAGTVVALQTARQPALIEGRANPSRPTTHTRRRHEAVADEAAPSLVPEQDQDQDQDQDLQSEETAEMEPPAEDVEEVAEADGEGCDSAADDNEASDEEGRV